MPKKRKPAPELAPATDGREFPLTHYLGSLVTHENHERYLLSTGAGSEALAGAAALLGSTLLRISQLSSNALRASAARALPEVERFMTHPGRYVEPAYTTYSDWTMDERSAEHVPAQEMTVAEAATKAAAAIRSCLPAEPSVARSRSRKAN